MNEFVARKGLLVTSGNVGIGTTSPKSLLHNNGSIFSGGTGDGTEINGSNVYMSVAAGAGISRGIKTSVTSDAGYAGMSIIGTNGTFSTSGLPSSGTYDRNLVYINGQTGNVGIGTTSPAELLHLQSSQPVIRYTKTGILNWKAGVITGNDYAITADNIATTALTIQSSTGNVGIGTTSPAYSLSIENSAEFLLGYKRTIGTGKQWAFGSDNSATFLRNITDAITAYTITNTGNVGIGTTSPATLIHGAIPSVNNNIAEIFRLSDGAIVDFKVLLNRGTSLGTSISVVNTAAGSMSFETSNTERMRITSTGNVGIGTTSPATQLHLNGSAELRMSNSANTTGFDIGLLGGNSDANAYIYQRANSNIIFGTNNTERMRITSAGNVLINTTSTLASKLIAVSSTSTSASYAAVFSAFGSSDILSLRGDGLITMPYLVSAWTTGNAANVWVDTANGNLYRSTSSIKYKKNVQDYTKGLTELMQLRPVSYEGKSEVDEGKTFAGLIAEEVHELGLTEYVQYDVDGSPNALSYQNMVTILIKSIQELKQELETLKNK